MAGDAGGGLGQRDPSKRGTEGGEGTGGAGGPHCPITPSQLISHPISSGLGAQDTANWLILLIPIISISVQAFGKEILCNNLHCVYSAFSWNRLNPRSLDPCLFSRTSS